MTRPRESKQTTGDPWLDLLAAMLRQAIKDAKRGNRGAAYWLWVVAPGLAGRAIDAPPHDGRGRQKR
jgi:hypothetical protein